jgi:branched-chain amino acid transport system substrate-binding protein
MKLPAILLCGCFTLLGGCGPTEPIRLGFLGGLSGRVADLGGAGRDGVQLAIEQANAGGGSMVARSNYSSLTTARMQKRR